MARASTLRTRQPASANTFPSTDTPKQIRFEAYPSPRPRLQDGVDDLRRGPMRPLPVSPRDRARARVPTLAPPPALRPAPADTPAPASRRRSAHAGACARTLRSDFHHISFQGTSAVSDEHFGLYLREVRKPGALRAGIAYYAAVWQDAEDNAPLADTPLPMPVLAVGGEASSGPAMEQIWSPVTTDLETFVIPRAGHWIGDENPKAVAERVAAFLGEGE